MGLDGVELVMDVEDRFGIRIPDGHAERIRTAGDLYLYVLGRVQRLKDGRCRSAVVFYRLRTALISAFDADRALVRLNTPVAQLVGNQAPHRAWKQLEQHLEFNLPGLRYPKWLGPGLLGGLICAVIAAVVGFNWSVVAGCALPLVILLSLVPLNRLATAQARVPTSCNTIRGLVGTIVARMPSDAETEPDAVWDTVRELISDITGVPRDSIKRDSRLVEDLNLG
jgi:acyl carrier protein